MTRFGIISEGITDQIVIKNILMGYFEDLEPDDIVQLQPGRELSPEELRDRTIQKLQTLIGETFYHQFAEQFFFAIAIHSIECWLLPLYCTDAKQAEQIKNCEKRLKRALIGELAKFTKTYDDYDRLSENYYLNPKKFPQYYPKNPSFKLFIEEIKTRNITI